MTRQNTKSNKDYQFESIAVPTYMLPGEWKCIEVLVRGDVQTTSFVMATKLHPNAKPYVDF